MPEHHSNKNKVESSDIKAQGDIHIGDQQISNVQNIVINPRDKPDNSLTRRSILVWLTSIFVSIGTTLTCFFNKTKEVKDTPSPKININGNNNVVNDMSGAGQNIINQTIIQKQEDTLREKEQ
jgi:hypothetical protein